MRFFAALIIWLIVVLTAVASSGVTHFFSNCFTLAVNGELLASC